MSGMRAAAGRTRETRAALRSKLRDNMMQICHPPPHSPVYRRWLGRLLGLALLSVSTSEPPVARADTPYQLDLRLDLPVLALGLAGTMAALVEVPPPTCFPACSAERINALDRSVLGNYSERAHTIADIGVFGLIALPPLLNALDSAGEGWAEDTVVLAQSLLITQSLTQLTKFAVRRTAPFVYDPNAPIDAVRGPDAARSFISGHTAMAFAATSTYATTFWLRHPDSPLRFLVLGLGAALALSVGALKVAAGYHFWTDVTAGALVGAGVGTLVPLLHAGTAEPPRTSHRLDR
jgi:membrane-associated phospholipid phosphatase